MPTSSKNKRKCHATITMWIATVNETNKRVQIRMRAYLLCIPLVEHTEVLINLSLSPFHSWNDLCFACSVSRSLSHILRWPFSHSVVRFVFPLSKDDIVLCADTDNAKKNTPKQYIRRDVSICFSCSSVLWITICDVLESHRIGIFNDYLFVLSTDSNEMQRS